jgi:hypothetical protein
MRLIQLCYKICGALVNALLSPNYIKALFGYCWIHLNPHVLGWIEVEFS